MFSVGPALPAQGRQGGGGVEASGSGSRRCCLCPVCMVSQRGSGEGHGSAAAWATILTLSPLSCVTLGQFLNLSVPYFTLTSGGMVESTRYLPNSTDHGSQSIISWAKIQKGNDLKSIFKKSSGSLPNVLSQARRCHTFVFLPSVPGGRNTAATKERGSSYTSPKGHQNASAPCRPVGDARGVRVTCGGTAPVLAGTPGGRCAPECPGRGVWRERSGLRPSPLASLSTVPPEKWGTEGREPRCRRLGTLPGRDGDACPRAVLARREPSGAPTGTPLGSVPVRALGVSRAPSQPSQELSQRRDDGRGFPES